MQKSGIVFFFYVRNIMIYNFYFVILFVYNPRRTFKQKQIYLQNRSTLIQRQELCMGAFKCLTQKAIIQRRNKKNYKNILPWLYMCQLKLVYLKQEISADIRAALNYSSQ